MGEIKTSTPSPHVIDDGDDWGGKDETISFTDPAGDVRDEGYKPPVNPFASAIVERDDKEEEFHI